MQTVKKIQLQLPRNECQRTIYTQVGYYSKKAMTVGNRGKKKSVMLLMPPVCLFRNTN